MSGPAGMPGSPQAAPGTPPGDWATQLVDTLDAAIISIRSRSTEPVLRVVRTVIFVLMALGLAVSALLLLTIAGVRFIDVYLPGNVWATYLLLGGIFVLGGWLCYRK